MKYVENSTCDVAVIGLGYVGLPLALFLASKKINIIGVDIDEHLLNKIKEGVCPINEEEIVKLFNEVKRSTSFRAQKSVPLADCFIVATPTPLHKRKKVADLSSLIEACKSLVPMLRKGALIIIESTIPPLTCREELAPLFESTGLKIGKDLFVSHCPERLFPGNVFHELQHNDRIIGGMCDESTRRSIEIYKTFVKGELLPTDDQTAEFCKLIENTYRDVNIALANELFMVTDRLGISISKAIELANRHPRVNILTPGIGVGGHCIPIDPWFITEIAPEQTQLIPMARRINDQMPHVITKKLRLALSNLESPKIGIFGTSYKPNVNDQRESPALEIIQELKEDGYDLEIYDPITHVGLSGNLLDFAKNKDALFILVEHQTIYPHIENKFKEIKKVMKNPLILRAGNFFQREEDLC